MISDPMCSNFSSKPSRHHIPHFNQTSLHQKEYPDKRPWKVWSGSKRMKEWNGKQQAAEDFVSEEAVCGVGPLALCWHDLCKASLGKISSKRSPGEVSEQDLSRSTLEELLCRKIYRKNAGRRFRGRRFARACAIEMHMNMSLEPFCVEIYKENAGRIWEHHDYTPGPNTYHRNPLSVSHCLGKNFNCDTFATHSCGSTTGRATPFLFLPCYAYRLGVNPCPAPILYPKCRRMIQNVFSQGSNERFWCCTLHSSNFFCGFSAGATWHAFLPWTIEGASWIDVPSNWGDLKPMLQCLGFKSLQFEGTSIQDAPRIRFSTLLDHELPCWITPATKR